MLASLSVFILSCFTSCVEVDSQRPADSFADGKFPPGLQRVADQKHELANVKGLAEHAVADATNPDILEVAVIDLGVDLAHPDLVNKISFDVKDGKIVGAGKDIMGDDSWASSNLVNPKYYAFGADLKGGRISNYAKNPLNLIKQYNDQFMDRLIKRIANDPELSKSLFNKITKDSMNVYGAYQLYLDNSFDEDAYLQLKISREVISAASYDRPLPKSAQTNLTNRLIHNIVDEPWFMVSDSGLPGLEAGIGDTENKLYKIEGADKFNKVFRSEFESFNKDSGFAKAVNSYVSYKTARASVGSDDAKGDMQQVLNDLSTALYFKQYGLKTQDPLQQLNQVLHASVALDSGLVRDDGAKPVRYKLNESMLNKRIDEALEREARVVEALNAISRKSVEENRSFTKMKAHYGALRSMVDWYRKQRDLNKTLTLNPIANGPQASLYRKYLMRSQHVMLSSDSATASHGSHVSGIIVAQNPDIRIVPVRVSTQSVRLNGVDGEKLMQNFDQKFAAWLAKPMVLKALGNRLEGAIDGVDFSATDPVICQASAQVLMKILGPQMQGLYERNSLDFVFMNEIMRAIQYVGERKVKIANISLGTKFQDAHVIFRAENPVDKLGEFSKFLLYEYFKYSVGDTIQKHAADTLFVIAAGNDGSWVDGESRSALPADISSKFLAPFENLRTGEVAPNNHLDNVLAVGSLNPRGEISSYTNIPIGSRTPFILASGESILSPVKSLDMDALKQLFDRSFPEFGRVAENDYSSDDRLNAFLDSEYARICSDRKFDTQDRKQLRAIFGADSRIFRNLLEAAKQAGLEGLVAKKTTSVYESRRSTNWLKLKLTNEEEFVIGGYTPGEREHFGSLAVGFYEDDELRYCGNVGTGFDERTLASLWKLLGPLTTAKRPFAKADKIPKGTVWVKPELVAQVKFANWTTDRKLRAPVYLGLRDDKRADEVVPEGKFTNLDKIYYPEDGITKGELIQYYDTVAPLLLPHLKDRPLSLKRYPNGIHGEHFFQKNTPDSYPAWLRTEMIEKTRFVLAQDKRSLLYLVNLGCIDQNPWMSRVGSLENPDYILIDLDPQECSYAKIVEAALLVKEKLDAIGLKSYPKTTGGDGMHIYIPIKPEYTYEMARSFAEVISRLRAGERPDLFTTPRAVEKREKNKVYFDWMQIAESKTISAPYVARAYKGAPVSTPLAWDEVKPGLEPGQFTIRNAPERFARVGDLFAGVLKHPQGLEKAFGKLEKLVHSQAGRTPPAKTV